MRISIWISAMITGITLSPEALPAPRGIPPALACPVSSASLCSREGCSNMGGNAGFLFDFRHSVMGVLQEGKMKNHRYELFRDDDMAAGYRLVEPDFGGRVYTLTFTKGDANFFVLARAMNGMVSADMGLCREAKPISP